jgi:ketosteroid isomerase-like protein
VEGESKIETVETVMAALADRDAELMVAQMTEDVVLRPSAFITGTGEYRGHADIRRGMAELKRQLADNRERLIVRPHAYYLDDGQPDKALTLARVTIVRSGGDEFGTEIAYLWTFRDDRVSRLDAWLDHAEGLAQLRAPRRARTLGDGGS